MDIYIGSIPFKWKEKDLEELFTPFGEVKSTKIIIDKISRQNKGFGFVTMDDNTSAHKAIKALHGIEIEGRNITVNVSLPKADVVAIKKYDKFNKSPDSNSSPHTKPKKKLPPWQRNEY
jgi:RNA recognition motif-containing protein